jgi:hypothetical protein
MLGFDWDEDPSHMSNWLDCLRGRKQPDRSSRICAIAGLHDGHRGLLVRQEIYQKAEAVLDAAPTG